MAKRKFPKNDQPELPLNGGAAASASEARDQRPEDSTTKAAPIQNPNSTIQNEAESAPPPPPPRRKGEKIQDDPAPLARHYRNWFLEYASYVILDRAVPHLDDGLKPVQRRVLHTLWDMDDGRFPKVANVVGATMKLHPHGDASIGAALVSIGQREWLIEPQGNYGNLLTGDDAAAPRYIEARLTAFAKDVLFNPKTTRGSSAMTAATRSPSPSPQNFPSSSSKA